MFYLIAILCVFGIAIGQILFKITSGILAQTGSIFAAKTLTMLFCAFGLYGITTIAWIWVLQKIELSKAYPLMALAFIIVPIGSYIFLNEKITYQYFIGVGLIMFGIFITLRAS